MRIDVITIFPAYLEPLRLSLVGKAMDAGVLDVRIHDLRDHATDRHRTVDDTPYGGGPGMVMRPDIWGHAIDAVLDSTLGPTDSSITDSSATDSSAADSSAIDDSGTDPRPHLIVPTPSGMPFRQADAHQWSGEPWLVFACGRYEGIDSRVMDHYASDPRVASVREVSIGDYVLAGGEAAVLVMVEAVARLLPGVLGNEASTGDDSFATGIDGVLEGPVFTKPPHWRDREVPAVLLSGDHARIAAWRREQGRLRTERVRPDLLQD
jgi:tRNA (guanine37-N1)-methyltransferase